MNDIHKILSLSCRNCGAPMGFDIKKQTYACNHCGETSGIADTLKNMAEWKALKAEDKTKRITITHVKSCSNCGAVISFPEGEASEVCDFCGGSLILSDLTQDEDKPGAIIPFMLTKAEAKERLLGWATEHQSTNEAKYVQLLLEDDNALKGYYLPYDLIRGPIRGRAFRDKNGRKYNIDGFLEGIAVNKSEQLDNMVLDAAEPFDWNGLKDFEAGYIAGQPVKLTDISDADVEERVFREASKGYLPYVSKVLKGTDVDLQMTESALLRISALLPMYFVVKDEFLAVVNGQTGKVSVKSLSAPKTSMRWLIEPTVITLAAGITIDMITDWERAMVAFITFPIAIVAFSIYSDKRNKTKQEKILAGEDVSAKRENGLLQIEDNPVIRNPISNLPEFYEQIGGQRVPVVPKFYSAGRIIKSVVELLLIIFLPAIVAGIFAPSGTEVHYQYGAAWYLITGFLAFLYCTHGMRIDVFNHPMLYTTWIDQSGRKQTKLVGDKKERKISPFTMLSGGERFSYKKMDKESKFLFWVVLLILVGSIAAMVS